MRIPRWMWAVLLGSTTGAAWAAPTTVSVGNVTTPTGPSAGSAQFPLTRTGDLGYAVMLEYRTVDGSALGGTHYTAAPSGSALLIEAGAASSAVSVPINPLVSGPNLAFVLRNLSRPGGALRFAVGPALVLPSSAVPIGLAASDLTGDGALDLAVARSGHAAIGVLRNTFARDAAEMSFASPLVLAVNESPENLIGADLDLDGRADIAVANFLTTLAGQNVSRGAAELYRLGRAHRRRQPRRPPRHRRNRRFSKPHSRVA
jgi:hypothetical protein